mgnify:FL=1
MYPHYKITVTDKHNTYTVIYINMYKNRKKKGETKENEIS